MILKRGVGIDHCIKNNKETRWKICTCWQQPIYLANGQIPSQLGTKQISIKSIAFYFYFGRKINGNRSQIGIKRCIFLQRFVLYPSMIVINHQLDRLTNAGKCMFSTWFNYFLQLCWQVHVFHHCQVTLIKLDLLTCFNSKVTPTSDTNYSCLVKTVEFVLTSHMWSISCLITPLAITRLGADTHTHTHTRCRLINFQKPNTWQPQVSTCLV